MDMFSFLSYSNTAESNLPLLWKKAGESQESTTLLNFKEGKNEKYLNSAELDWELFAVTLRIPWALILSAYSTETRTNNNILIIK